MSDHIPEAAVEALLPRMYGTQLAVIATLWTEVQEGYRADLRKDCREALAAALPHLVTEEAVERVARAIYSRDVVPYPGSKWEGEREACRAAYRERGVAALRAALGIQDEQEDER